MIPVAGATGKENRVNSSILRGDLGGHRPPKSHINIERFIRIWYHSFVLAALPPKRTKKKLAAAGETRSLRRRQPKE
jgi:hypothetical protein